MRREISRREMLSRTSRAALISSIAFPHCLAQQKSRTRWEPGAIVGENEGMRVGLKILADGGNAVDAAVGAALTASVAAPARSGIAGYGGHMVIALAGGKTITAIDFNTVAPAAARPDMFPLDETGAVKGRANFFGWLAAGVPGVLAGLQLALDRYGTRSFRELVQPAIQIAEKGFVINKTFGNTLHTAAARFASDAGSAKLYFKDGQILKEGEVLRNPGLAKMLSALAERNSVESFYRGDIAQRIAEGFQKNSGLVTARDLAAYHAREVQPLQLPIANFAVFTAPLTAAGLTILEALAILKALDFAKIADTGPAAHAQLEAMRLAWKDRLELFGDPEQVKVPVEKLLSPDYAHELASKVQTAVKEKKPIETGVPKHTDDGTNNLCVVDRHGNLVAITLTHGSSFGAQVTVEGLGLTLGHGMSRFDPHPSHPNSPGSGKRPVHNMCPSIVVRDGVPIMSVGCAGGVRIPNCIIDMLTQSLLRGVSMHSAVAAPRLHCTGTLDVGVEPHWPKDSAEYLREIGFKVQTGESTAVVGAASFDPKTGECDATIRGPAILGLNLPDSSSR
jgi:gamma-glutamyltranspeptidase/glutathione hydrolase